MMRTDPKARVYLYQLGTDQLESLFSIIRTITHAHNCSLLELSQRFTSAYQITSARSSHPNWQHEKRREALTYDHSSVNSWTGVLNTENLSHNSLKSIWNNGKPKAINFLKEVSIKPLTPLNLSK